MYHQTIKLSKDSQQKKKLLRGPSANSLHYTLGLPSVCPSVRPVCASETVWSNMVPRWFLLCKYTWPISKMSKDKSNHQFLHPRSVVISSALREEAVRDSLTVTPSRRYYDPQRGRNGTNTVSLLKSATLS